jgi:hypothetical protein
MKNRGRRKFLFAGISLAAIWGIFQFGFRKKPEKPKTAKFLTQDGRLVEIDVDKLPVAKRTATKTDIQNWIKNKNL